MSFSIPMRSGTTPAESEESLPAMGDRRGNFSKKQSVALKCMEHRGGVCGDAGDGAGITTGIPHAFLKEEAKRLKLGNARYLKAEDTLAVGVVYHSDIESNQLEQARTD